MSKTWSIFRKTGGTVATVHELEYHGEWMEDEYVTVTVTSPTPVDFHFGDHLEYRGEQFVIDYNPNFIKKARKNSYGEAFAYENIKLYSLARELYDVAFKDYVLNWQSDANKNAYSSQGKFSFFADSIEDMADRLQANLDRVSEHSWTVLTPNYRRVRQRISEDVPDSEWLKYYHPSASSISELTEEELTKFEGNRDIEISVDNQSCRSVLQTSYKNFGLSYIIRNRTIIIGAPAIAANHIFKYGKDNGLYEIDKTSDDNQTIITKLYSYGSSENLPLNYYANMHKYFYGVIEEIHTKDPDDYHYAEFTLDLYYIAGMFDIRNMGPNNASYQVGWVVKTSIDGVEITCKVENISKDPWPKLRLYMEQRTESEDPSDEPDLEKLIAYIRNIEVGKRVVFTYGFNKNIWPQDHVDYENENQYPALLSIGNLMLPGFPDMSLDTWLRKVAAEQIHSDIISYEKADALLEKYIFSDEQMSPWIMSKNATNIGVKEGSLYFDGSNDDRPEIMPSIEGTGAGVVVEGSAVTDSGYLGDGEKAQPFKIRVAANEALDWAEAWDTKQEDIYIEMKSGFCTGRKFKLVSLPKLSNGSWELELDRDQDTSMSRYFPYYDNDVSHYCQILEDDTFVVTGLQMPASYVKAASERQLLASCDVLDKIDRQKETWVPKVDEIFMANQHDDAKANGGTSLHDTLMAGMCIHVEDEDLELNLTTYIDNLTIKENGNNGIPTYDVVLRDEKDITDIQRTIDIVGGMAGLGDLLSYEEIVKLIKQIGNSNYLSKKKDDTAQGHITFMRGLTALGAILLGDYVEGLQGGKLTPEGYAELEKLWVRTMATIGDGLKHYEDGKLLPALEVKGDATFTDNLSTPDFQSGFPAGIGWALQKKEYVNPAGVVEYKYYLEVDNVSVRNTLRVYEFIISQLLGENDNRIFTAMMEVHHYDAETGKVWLTTNGGRLYNPFRVDDCIMVQQYQPGNTSIEGGTGYITKAYELLISEVGIGTASDVDENGDRLDWVKFTNFTTQMNDMTPALLIKQRDTFCRVDNLTDDARKGIIQMMAVGINAPYMDVIYGMKTDPDNALKVRLGNLQGIIHHLFGQLDGFGLYAPNFYGVGDFRLRHSGESLSNAIEMTRDQSSSKYTEVSYELTDDDNYLRNAGFVELTSAGALRDWTVTGEDISFYSVGGEAVVSSVGTLGNVKSCCRTEIVDDKLVMHLVDGALRQSRSVMKTPTTHKEYTDGDTDTYTNVLDTLYMAVRIKVVTAGTLTIGFPDSSESSDNAIKGKTRQLERDSEWKLLQWSGTWDGNTDFKLSFTGECYISMLALSSSPLDSFKTEYSTQVIQTARRWAVISTKTTKNSTDIAQLEVTAQQIQSTVSSNYTDLNGRVNANSSAITQTAAAIRAEVKSTTDGLGSRIGSLELRADSFDVSISSINNDIDDLDDDISGAKTRIGRLELRADSFDVSISNRLTKAEFRLFLTSDDISNAQLNADKINFTFTQSTSFIDGSGNTVVVINSSGLKVNGTIEAGSSFTGGNYNLSNNVKFYVSGTKFAEFSSTDDSFASMLYLRHDGGTALSIGSYSSGGKGISIVANADAMAIYSIGPIMLCAGEDEYIQMTGRPGFNNYRTYGFFAPAVSLRTASFTLPASPADGTLLFCHGVTADLIVTTRSHPIMTSDGRGNDTDAYTSHNYNDDSIILMFSATVNKWILFKAW